MLDRPAPLSYMHRLSPRFVLLFFFFFPLPSVFPEVRSLSSLDGGSGPGRKGSQETNYRDIIHESNVHKIAINISLQAIDDTHYVFVFLYLSQFVYRTPLNETRRLCGGSECDLQSDPELSDSALHLVTFSFFLPCRRLGPDNSCKMRCNSAQGSN
ncbi:hypothetical protein ABW19_dt0204884 [Dactylella cylindrospora]|nr:hypothetical protein ABW19_dt0204884 [Dactylella cylindrospora]